MWCALRRAEKDKPMTQRKDQPQEGRIATKTNAMNQLIAKCLDNELKPEDCPPCGEMAFVDGAAGKRDVCLECGFEASGPITYYKPTTAGAYVGRPAFLPLQPLPDWDTASQDEIDARRAELDALAVKRAASRAAYNEKLAGMTATTEEQRKVA